MHQTIFQVLFLYEGNQYYLHMTEEATEAQIS